MKTKAGTSTPRSSTRAELNFAMKKPVDVERTVNVTLHAKAEAAAEQLVPDINQPGRDVAEERKKVKEQLVELAETNERSLRDDFTRATEEIAQLKAQLEAVAEQLRLAGFEGEELLPVNLARSVLELAEMHAAKDELVQKLEERVRELQVAAAPAPVAELPPGGPNG